MRPARRSTSQRKCSRNSFQCQCEKISNLRRDERNVLFSYTLLSTVIYLVQHPTVSFMICWKFNLHAKSVNIFRKHTPPLIGFQYMYDWKDSFQVEIQSFRIATQLLSNFLLISFLSRQRSPNILRDFIIIQFLSRFIRMPVIISYWQAHCVCLKESFCSNQKCTQYMRK